MVIGANKSGANQMAASEGNWSLIDRVISAADFEMAVGEHRLVTDPVLRWEPALTDTNPPNVMLTASIDSGPKPPLYPVPDYGATTLALKMNVRIATELYKKLGDLLHSMPKHEDSPS